MNKSLLIVLYKEDIYTSQSVQSFLRCKPLNTKLIIWDNSPSILPNEQIKYLKSQVTEIKYIHTPENLALSKLYNKFWADNANSELLYFFDQDSHFTSDYFKKSEKAYSENPDIGLFIPYVKVEAKNVSPGYFKYYKGHYLKSLELGRINAKNKLAITSGMAIAPSRVGALRFDENLSLYGIDTKFMLDYGDAMSSLFVIDYQLKHSLTEFENNDLATNINRCLKYRSSVLYILKQKSSFFYTVAATVWAAKIVSLYILYYIKKLSK